MATFWRKSGTDTFFFSYLIIKILYFLKKSLFSWIYYKINNIIKKKEFNFDSQIRFTGNIWNFRPDFRGRKVAIVVECGIKAFFNTCMNKVLFLRRKVNRKSNISSVWRGLSTVAGGKVLSLPLYDDSIYPISHSLFMQKRSYSCTY